LAKDLVGALVGVWHGCVVESVLFTTSKRSVGCRQKICSLKEEHV
jgi:hypothetical protein